ncbi:MAG: DUF3793 family protein [Spirochaetaceae bacterium]|nr:DUF3793 family protein [Spirochaetaceae bacterium]MBQ8353330.1 DUF3793 family protein [Spirochaetaceae bacterium]
MLSYQILQSASPTICKIKPGNMFTVKKFQFDTKSSIEWKKLLSKQDIELEWFSTTNNVIMYFSYNKKWISEILKNKKIKKFLLEKNYPIHLDNKAIIEELFFRLKNSNTFPHEVGVFLGYPLEDVISFEKNQGKNCKYCGLWKSYSNPSKAKKCCNQYANCSQLCTQWFCEGYSIPQIIKKYKRGIFYESSNCLRKYNWKHRINGKCN